MEEQPDSVQLDTKADAVRIVDTLKRMPDMVRAKVDFGGEMNIRNSKMAEIEKTAAANAERNGTGAGTEKQKLVDGILKDAEPVVNRMKELAGKMNGMVERIGNPQILRTNTFYQQYKMEYDFCARKLIDSGIAWGDGQVVKEYISKNSLFQDKMELRRTNYMQSYRDRIVTGGSEQFETDSYLKDTTYDYGKWAKVGDLLAKTIYRPFFSKVEREVDREPKEDRFEKKEQDPQGKEDAMKPELEKQSEAAVEQPEKPEENAQVSKDADGGPVDQEGAKMPVDQPEDLSNDLLEEQPESVDKYAEDIFGNESIDYDTILQAAADSISEKLSNAPDADRDYYQQASADIAYEISDLNGNLWTIWKPSFLPCRTTGSLRKIQIPCGIRPGTAMKTQVLTRLSMM